MGLPWASQSVFAPSSAAAQEPATAQNLSTSEVYSGPALAKPAVTNIEIGFAGRLKLGRETTLRVQIQGADPPLRLEAFAPDPDNLPVMTTASVEPNPTPDGEAVTVTLPIRFGRKNATLRTRLVSEAGDEIIDDQSWQLDADDQFIQLAATDLMVVCFGNVAPQLVEQLFAVEEGRRPSAGTQALRQRGLSLVNTPGVGSVDQLPSTWSGYEAANAVVLHLSSAEELSDATLPARLTALRQWVEMGGQLIFSCSPEIYPQLSAMPELKALMPGNSVEAYTLNQFAAIEAFATAEDPLPRSEETRLTVARLSETSGTIEASIGRDATEVPLVIRKSQGLGEVVFVAFDLSAPEIQQWSGLPALVNQLLGGQDREEILMEAPPSGQLVSRGYNDLAGALYQRLGSSFGDAVNLSMLTITAIALAYLLVIGPLDWLLVTQGLKRPGLTWVTFPMTALLLGGGLWQASSWVKASGICVNSVELVDVDLETGLLRGQLLAQIYSPTAQRYDIRLEAHSLKGQTIEPSLESIAWWGLPGSGLGGMRTAATELPLTNGYAAQASPETMLEQIPINTGSTKSVVARWQASSAQAIEVDLIANDNGLVEGSLVNRTGCDLQSCRLVYGQWAWRLKQLRDGDLISIDESIAPLKFRTLLKRDMQATATRPRLNDRQITELDPDELPPEKLLQLIMFSQRGDAEGLVEVDSQALSYLDLSRHLLSGRAVLYARCEEPRSQLTLNKNEVAAGNRVVYYRFSLPVSRP